MSSKKTPSCKSSVESTLDFAIEEIENVKSKKAKIDILINWQIQTYQYIKDCNEKKLNVCDCTSVECFCEGVCLKRVDIEEAFSHAHKQSLEFIEDLSINSLEILEWYTDTLLECEEVFKTGFYGDFSYEDFIKLYISSLELTILFIEKNKIKIKEDVEKSFLNKEVMSDKNHISYVYGSYKIPKKIQKNIDNELWYIDLFSKKLEDKLNIAEREFKYETDILPQLFEYFQKNIKNILKTCF